MQQRLFMLKKLKPEYRDRSEVRGTFNLSKIDVDKLPDSIIQRISDGEDIMAVLASEAKAVIKALNVPQIPEGEYEELDDHGDH